MPCTQNRSSGVAFPTQRGGCACSHQGRTQTATGHRRERRGLRWGGRHPQQLTSIVTWTSKGIRVRGCSGGSVGTQRSGTSAAVAQFSLAPHPNLGRSSGPGCHWFTSEPDLHGGAGHRRERNRISAPPCLPPHPRRHHEASLRASPVSSHSLCLRTFG